MSTTTTTQDHGLVSTVHHPLVSITGLNRVRIGELLQFENNTWGQVFTITGKVVDAMVFTPTPLQVGCGVTRTGRVLEVAVSPEILGQTINALGKKFTGTSATGKYTIPVDSSPRPLTDRHRISQTLRTGVTLVDLVLPLGKGQRQLIVGDRKTGKSSFALQLVESQVLDGAKVVYAIVGKRLSEIKQLQEYLVKKNMVDQVTIVASAADDPPPVIYQTPFTAMTVAEYLSSLGNDVVVILDDLTTHARYYREISLVGKRFPGRDSYPGDIFYTHARLLERAGCFEQLLNVRGSVSISCFPFAETTESDVTDYIVSNLISITDGHLLFDSGLFSQGHRPAIHSSLSVTRVGKQTQSALLRELSYTLSSFINLYEKTQSLTHFGAELTAETKAILSRGQALFALLNQKKEQVFPETVMVLMACAVLLDWFNELSDVQIQTARDQLNRYFHAKKENAAELDAMLAETEKLNTALDMLVFQKQALMDICRV